MKAAIREFGGLKNKQTNMRLGRTSVGEDKELKGKEWGVGLIKAYDRHVQNY